MDTHRPSDATVTTLSNPTHNNNAALNMKAHAPKPIQGSSRRQFYLFLRMLAGIVGLIAFAVLINFHVRRNKPNRDISDCRRRYTIDLECVYELTAAYQQPWWALAMTASVISLVISVYDIILQCSTHRLVPLHKMFLHDAIIIGISAAAGGCLVSSDAWKIAGPDGYEENITSPGPDLLAPLAVVFTLMTFHIFMVVFELLVRPKKDVESHPKTAEAKNEPNSTSSAQVGTV